MSTELAVVEPVRELPPIPAEHDTPAIRRRVEHFFLSIAGIFETWVQRSDNAHTQRSYREAVLGFVSFMGIQWPEEDWRLVKDVAVADVRAWRDAMKEKGAAPNTLNHHISALSRFYEFLQERAAGGRLPILLANPAHKDFIKRKTAKPRRQAAALSLNLLHQSFAMPEGDSPLAWRDRAILYYMYGAAARRETACVAQVSDVRCSEEAGPTVYLRLKGDKAETIGLHVKAYETIRTYLEVAGLESGPLFRTRLNPKSKKLGPLSSPGVRRAV